jgi:hypothetical protein
MSYFSVMAIFKNEAMMLKEWLDHYIWQGAEHFYLIDHGSTDFYIDVLMPYIDNDLVTLWTRTAQFQQAKLYTEMFKVHQPEMGWLAVADVDEFFYGPKRPLIRELDDIRRRGFNEVFANWQMFGTEHDRQPESVRRDVKRAWAKHHNQVKNIVWAEDFESLHVHWAPRKKRVPSLAIHDSKRIKLNHYQLISREYFEKVKMTRGDVNCSDRLNLRDWNYFDDVNKNATTTNLELSRLVEYGYT